MWVNANRRSKINFFALCVVRWYEYGSSIIYLCVLGTASVGSSVSYRRLASARQWGCKIKSDNPKADILAVHLGSRRKVKGRQIGWNLDFYFNLYCYVSVILHTLSPFYFTDLNKEVYTELILCIEKRHGCLTSIPCNTMSWTNHENTWIRSDPEWNMPCCKSTACVASYSGEANRRK